MRREEKNRKKEEREKKSSLLPFPVCKIFLFLRGFKKL